MLLYGCVPSQQFYLARMFKDEQALYAEVRRDMHSDGCMCGMRSISDAHPLEDSQRTSHHISCTRQERIAWNPITIDDNADRLQLIEARGVSGTTNSMLVCCVRCAVYMLLSTFHHAMTCYAHLPCCMFSITSIHVLSHTGYPVSPQRRVCLPQRQRHLFSRQAPHSAQIQPHPPSWCRQISLIRIVHHHTLCR